MSSRALQSLIRPAFRQSACVVCRPSTRLQSPPPAVAAASRTYAKKAKSGSSAHHKKGSSSKAVEEQQNVVAAAKGKKGKGKGGFLDTDPDAMVETVAADEVGVYDLKILETEMDNAIERLRVGLKSVVGRVGRVSPALLDHVRVEAGDGQGKRPLNEFATVTVKDGKDLLVTCYDEAFVKHVSAALYASNLNLTPQATSATSLRVPIPKPDWDKRQQFVRQASDLCESARVAIRNSRTKGIKDIKQDVDGKVVSKDEGRADTKMLDTSTKKRTDEVDSIFEKAKEVLMDE